MPLDPATNHIEINGTSYPVSEWANVQTQESLKLTWQDGFWGGAGQVRYKDPNRYFYAHGWDMTSPPYARLVPKPTAILLDTGVLDEFDANKPAYIIRTRDTDTPFANVVYLFSGQYVWKFNRDLNTKVYGPNAVVGASFGHPVLFNGVWYVPCGDKSSPSDATAYPNIKALTPTTAGSAASELADAVAAKARHLAILPPADTANDPTTKVARAHAGTTGAAMRIETKTSVATFSGAIDTTFQVGDASLPISELAISQGELLVFKPDGPYRFDPEGNSMPLQQYVGATLKINAGGVSSTLGENQFEGSNSISHGVFAYWVHPSGLWRIFGNNLLPVGFEADPEFFGSVAADIDPGVQWNSVAAYGRWIYASRGGQVWQGYIQDNGIPIWHGAIFDLTSIARFRVAIDDGPALWVFGDTGTPSINRAWRTDLAADGSTRGILTGGRGHTHMSVSNLRIGLIDFDRPERLKQLKKLWFYTEGMTGATSIQPKVERDGAAAQNWGNPITSSFNGYTEHLASAMGTNDSFRECRIGVEASLYPGTTDPRIRAMGMECQAAAIYRAKITLTDELVRGYSGGIIGLMDNLRTLQNGPAVEIRAPGRHGTFTGYIMAARETTESVPHSDQPQYIVEVLIESFNAEAGIN